MTQCYVCSSTTEELRPYGLNGQDICYHCMMACPERQAEAEHQFDMVFTALKNPILGDGDRGPREATQDELSALGLIILTENQPKN